MKPSVIFGAVSLSFALACSANSGEDGKGKVASGTGNTGSGANTGTGGPDLGPDQNTGGSVNLGPVETTAGTTGAPVENGECAEKNFVLASKPADILLVLDRSASMVEHTVPPSNATRWDAVVKSMTAVISATDSSVSWGLKLFPEGEGKECNAMTVTDAVPAPIMPGNAAAVNGIINSTMASGNGTPTGDAIAKAAAYLKSRNASNQYIVLATDGDPSCPSSGDAALTYAVSKIAEAKAAGFPTFVIGVLDPVENKSSYARLNAMAEAGGTSRSDNPVADKFYQAYSQDALADALRAVTGQVVSCVFEFDNKPPDPTNIAVKINGQWIEQDATKAEGWEYTSDQYMGLELHGDACQQVKDASDNHVDIIFGCKGRPIPR